MEAQVHQLTVTTDAIHDVNAERAERIAIVIQNRIFSNQSPIYNIFYMFAFVRSCSRTVHINIAACNWYTHTRKIASGGGGGGDAACGARWFFRRSRLQHRA